MRKLIASEFVSLDGVIENPAWTMPYWSDEIGQYKHRELFASDGLLLGRITYQGFAEAWPSRTGEDGYADRINSLPKWVVSNTLTETGWNAELITGDLVEAVTRVKQAPGQDILLFGSGQLVQTLMQHALIDEYRLLIYPVVVGSGQRLFHEGSTARLRLVSTQTFASGVVAHTYQPDHR